jgi:SP family sugar:H+ symporter-like MFS transporter
VHDPYRSDRADRHRHEMVPSVADLGVGPLSSLVPMYQSEFTPRQVRGGYSQVSYSILLGNTVLLKLIIVNYSAFQLFMALEIFIAQCINVGSTPSWRITMGISFAWPLILGLGILSF